MFFNSINGHKPEVLLLLPYFSDNVILTQNNKKQDCWIKSYPQFEDNSISAFDVSQKAEGKTQMIQFTPGDWTIKHFSTTGLCEKVTSY